MSFSYRFWRSSTTTPLGDREGTRGSHAKCLLFPEPVVLIPSEEAEVDGASPMRFRPAVLVPADRLHQRASKRDRRVVAHSD